MVFKIKDPKGFDALMRSPHYLRIKVELLTLTGGDRGDLSKMFMDGQVTVDSTAATTRALDLTLFDPTRRVSLDPTNPSRTSIFISDMIQITYIIVSPDRTKSWAVPVFTGPIDDVERDETMIKIKALGKEQLSLGNQWRGKTYKKGQLKTGVIKSILKEEIGEKVVSVPNLPSKLPAPIKLNREKSPWFVAKNLAQTVGSVLFYDATGTAVMRKKKVRSKYQFNDRNVTSKPSIAYDLSKTINAVVVLGKKPKKGKKRPKATVKAKKSHPLSPQNLGRPGAPRYLWLQIEDQSLRSSKECRRVAKKQLAAGLLAGVDIRFEGIPNPRLQEHDIVAINTSKVKGTFPIKMFTIPLVAGHPASFGWVRQIGLKGKGKDKNRTGSRLITGRNHQ